MKINEEMYMKIINAVKFITLIVILVTIFFILPFLLINREYNNYNKCLNGEMTFCTESKWCEIQGGKYFSGGLFGGGNCIYPKE